MPQSHLAAFNSTLSPYSRDRGDLLGHLPRDWLMSCLHASPGPSFITVWKLTYILATNACTMLLVAFIPAMRSGLCLVHGLQMVQGSGDVGSLACRSG